MKSWRLLAARVLNYFAAGKERNNSYGMKNWHLLVALLYGIMLAIVILPLTALCFFSEAKSMIVSLYSSWICWIWLLFMVLAQVSLLAIPVKIANRRQINKKPVVLTVISSALMCALLAAGVVLSVGEVAFKDGFNKIVWWGAGVVLVLMWVFWSVIFLKYSKKLEPATLLDRLCMCFVKGSILELLIAIPAHIIARVRNYCCAGTSTFVGIVFGVSVMLFAFGPAVFFLFYKKMSQYKGGADS